MGNSESQFGLRALKVVDKSPAQVAEIKPFVDYVTKVENVGEAFF